MPHTPGKTDRCGICGGPLASTIHMTDSPNTEIRMGAHEFTPDDYVAWMRYSRRGDITRIVVSDSGAPGAFQVYRRREAPDLLAQTQRDAAVITELRLALATSAKDAIADYVDDHGMTCDCCQHVMIDVTAAQEDEEKQHCVAGDCEGEGVACAWTWHEVAGKKEEEVDSLRAELKRDAAVIAELVAALRAARVQWNRGPSPKKFDEALTWLGNDEKVARMVNAAILAAESRAEAGREKSKWGTITAEEGKRRREAAAAGPIAVGDQVTAASWVVGHVATVKEIVPGCDDADGVGNVEAIAIFTDGGFWRVSQLVKVAAAAGPEVKRGA